MGTTSLALHLAPGAFRGGGGVVYGKNLTRKNKQKGHVFLSHIYFSIEKIMLNKSKIIYVSGIIRFLTPNLKKVCFTKSLSVCSARERTTQISGFEQINSTRTTIYPF